jgi:hypothetical protein
LLYISEVLNESKVCKNKKLEVLVVFLIEACY